MRKAFLKSQAPALCLGLLIVSTPTLAAFSEDPDCKPVSDAAKISTNRVSSRIDEVATSTGNATARAKSCVDEVVAGYNRAVPDFGGGISGTLSKFASDLMAQQGCQLLSSAANRATSMVPSVVQPATTAVINGVNMNSATTSTAATPTIWQRLSSIF